MDNTQYKIVGLDKTIGHQWCGVGNKPYILKVLADGEVYAPNAYRRRFFNYYPPDVDYIHISNNMSVTMQNLSILCKEHRLLDGDIQWIRYANDEIYREYVDTQAERWYKQLLIIDKYWEDGKATDEYRAIRDSISDELLDLDNELKRIRGKRRAVAYVTGRLSGRDVPKKIYLDENER